MTLKIKKDGVFEDLGASGEVVIGEQPPPDPKVNDEWIDTSGDPS